MELASSLFISTTSGGECLSLAASIATIDELEKRNAHAHIFAMGERLQAGLNSLAERYGVPARMECLPVFVYLDFRGDTLEQSHQMADLFMQEMVLRGVLWGGSFICYSHSEADIDATLHASEEAFATVRRAREEDNLEGYLMGGRRGAGMHRMV